ncbi:MAG: hypothetical protein ACO1OB_06625, partial [Archangium sp.]
MKTLLKFSLSAALLGGMFSGCEDEAPPPPPPAVARKKAPVEAAPVVAATQVDYVYNAINKRDPFRGT